ncbi:MAG: hypothetical protein ACREO3_08345 [Arenimonas sp.]
MNTFTKYLQNDFVRLAFLVGLLAASVASAEPVTNDIEDAGPVFNASSQYTAVYHQAAGQWQILPVTGQDVAIDTGSCAAGNALPPGIWLVTRDDAGRVQLVAPSTTVLPAGAADTIAVRACDQAEPDALVLPQPLIDLLAAGSGAVLVE